MATTEELAPKFHSMSRYLALPMFADQRNLNGALEAVEYVVKSALQFLSSALIRALASGDKLCYGGLQFLPFVARLNHHGRTGRMTYRVECARLDEATTNKIRSLEEDLKCLVVALEVKGQYAKLSDDQFKKLRHIESELGVSLVAYQATDYYRIASVPGETLQRVQQLEKDTGLVFVAYQHIRQEPTRGSFLPDGGYEVAALSEDQAKRLRHRESETNLLLMAYKAQ